MAEMKEVNPWTWQDKLQFSQAIEVRGGGLVLYCAGQTSVDADGTPMHKGNMRAQLDQALTNLETVLTHAGLSLSNVVRLNYYVTDMTAFFEASAVLGQRLAKARCKPAGTLLHITSLAFPGLMVEIEATAVE
jgi:enamine deaminase RidA (YjgF/YER057c/UK114 family)